MKAKDLRIGNIVHYRVTDELDERKEWNERNVIESQDLLVIEKSEQMEIPHEYSPIPLDTGFLIQQRFSNTDKPHIYSRTVIIDEKSSYEFRLVIQNEKIHFNFMMGGYSLSKHLEFVHELQNLFFTTIGNELIEPAQPSSPALLPTGEGSEQPAPEAEPPVPEGPIPGVIIQVPPLASYEQRTVAKQKMDRMNHFLQTRNHAAV